MRMLHIDTISSGVLRLEQFKTKEEMDGTTNKKAGFSPDERSAPDHEEEKEQKNFAKLATIYFYTASFFILFYLPLYTSLRCANCF